MKPGPVLALSLALAPALAALCAWPARADPGLRTPVEYQADLPRERIGFREIWAYLMQNEESFIPAGAPITDLAYFSGKLSSKGELYGVPPADRLSGVGARKHLVIAEVSNQALTHFVLAPEFRLRDKLVEDIAAAAKPYDGVVIDFELVPSYDASAFMDFLSLLKSRLAKKTLSVCVPARTRKIEDAYDYAKISAIADRVFVMAYDEHWSTSAAGPVASLAWSGRISAWARGVVPADKLVMGMPFYGRGWGDQNPAMAYRFSTALKKLAEKSAALERDDEGIPYFRFSETVNYVIHFDDAVSTARRSRIHRDNGVTMIGFWRLGQEDPTIWAILRIGDD